MTRSGSQHASSSNPTPLGVVSIVLVMLQPLAVGAWCLAARRRRRWRRRVTTRRALERVHLRVGQDGG